MHKKNLQRPEIKLVGITTRTNNAHIFEADTATNKIAATVQKYFKEGLSQQINDRKNPGTTLCVYTDYESDLHGDYTYFIGEEVNSFDFIPPEFEKLVIPAQYYAKFTQGPGPMPSVCVEMWKEIWAMNDADLGGARNYLADFEVYDERSLDHSKVTLDIFIGVKS